MRSLEASFRVSDAQYARLLDEEGKLAPLNAVVSLKLGDRMIEARATLDRPAAMVGTEGGRTIYARIEATAQTPMRPGDFVSIAISEPPLDQVAEIPARAATESGDIFLIGEDGRLTEHTANILRRLPETLIVSAVPFGSKIVAERRPQLGAGIKVQSPEQAALRAAEEKKKSDARRAARAKGGKGGEGKGERGGKNSNRPDKAESADKEQGGASTNAKGVAAKGNAKTKDASKNESRNNDIAKRRGRREPTTVKTP